MTVGQGIHQLHCFSAIPKAMSLAEIVGATKADLLLQKLRESLLSGKWPNVPKLRPFYLVHLELSVSNGLIDSPWKENHNFFPAMTANPQVSTWRSPRNSSKNAVPAWESLVARHLSWCTADNSMMPLLSVHVRKISSWANTVIPNAMKTTGDSSYWPLSPVSLRRKSTRPSS